MGWVSCCVVLLLCFSDGVGSCPVVKIVGLKTNYPTNKQTNKQTNRAVRAVGLPPTRSEDKVAQTQTSGRSMFLSPPGKGGMKS